MLISIRVFNREARKFSRRLIGLRVRHVTEQHLSGRLRARLQGPRREFRSQCFLQVDLTRAGARRRPVALTLSMSTYHSVPFTRALLSFSFSVREIVLFSTSQTSQAATS